MFGFSDYTLLTVQLSRMIGTENSVRDSQMPVCISSGQKRRVEPEYFHILLDELMIYFHQTRSECGKTNISFPVGI